MKKGDWIFCVTDEFAFYTKGKKYQLLKDVNGTVLEIVNDKGQVEHPSYYGVREVIDNYKFTERRFGARTHKVYYFISIEEWREDRINQILKL